MVRTIIGIHRETPDSNLLHSRELIPLQIRYLIAHAHYYVDLYNTHYECKLKNSTAIHKPQPYIVHVAVALCSLSFWNVVKQPVTSSTHSIGKQNLRVILTRKCSSAYVRRRIEMNLKTGKNKKIRIIPRPSGGLRIAIFEQVSYSL